MNNKEKIPAFIGRVTSYMAELKKGQKYINNKLTTIDELQFRLV